MKFLCKSQISVEFMVVMAFVLLMITPTILIFRSQIKSMNEQVNINQAYAIEKKIISSAEEMYYFGSPSKTTIKVYMPSGVKNIKITDNEIIFNVTTQYGTTEVVQATPVNLTGSISHISGLKYITIESTDTGANITSN